MNTCKTCKWWINGGVCDLISNAREEIKDPKDAADDTGLHSELRTGADFGCTLHVLTQ